MTVRIAKASITTISTDLALMMRFTVGTRPLEYCFHRPVALAIITINMQTTAPCDDVDETELPANGGIGAMVNRDYRMVPAKGDKVEGGGQHALRRLAEDTLKLDTKGFSLRDLLESLKGQDVKVFNEPRQDKKDEEVFYNNITKILSAED